MENGLLARRTILPAQLSTGNITTCIKKQWSPTALEVNGQTWAVSLFLRNVSAYKQSQYRKVGHWGYKYMGVCHSEGPRPVSNRMVCMRAHCMVRLGWLSLCPSWHSPRVLAINQPDHGECCRAYSSLGITQPALLHMGWREMPQALACVGWATIPPTALMSPSVQTQSVTSCNHLPFLCKEVRFFPILYVNLE